MGLYLTRCAQAVLPLGFADSYWMVEWPKGVEMQARSVHVDSLPPGVEDVAQQLAGIEARTLVLGPEEERFPGPGGPKARRTRRDEPSRPEEP